MIFSRSGGKNGRHGAEEPRRSRSSSEREHASDSGAQASAEAQTAAAGGRDRGGDRLVDPVDLDFGPYDVTEAPEADYLDLGSLKIPTVEGVEVRVQANNEGVVQQVVLVVADSALQLAAFAAPRGEGIWDDVRANIRQSMAAEGVTAQETSGEYGAELRAQVPAEQGMTDLRFIGVDGPRWMVRAIYQGPAATDPAAAGPLAECLRGLVVDRGKEAMPAEEALPLLLPREMAEAANAQMAAQAESAAQGHNGVHGDPPIAGDDQQGRPSPRPRRPE